MRSPIPHHQMPHRDDGIPGTLTPCEAYLSSLERFGMRPGLERIEALLERCGAPHRSLTCIHVAGTNGKGSVCALVESVLRAAGYRTGLYTSPHLVSYRERIRVCGREVGEAQVERIAAELIPHAERLAASPCGSPTYFEFMTALAFCVFAQEAVDYAILETGLGGRLDATNVVSAPVVAITSVGLEHQAQLGRTLSAIAAEKAAIITRGAFVVCGEMRRTAREVVVRRCREKGATLVKIGDDILYSLIRQSPEGSVLRMSVPCGAYDDIFLPLAGHYQLSNCAVAIGVVEGLKRRGAVLSQESVREGIAAVRWPGRLEALCREPLFIVDCAHNPAAARAVAAAVREIFAGRRWCLVLGILRDKNIPKICEALAPLATAVVATRVPSARSAEPAEVARACRARTRAVVRSAGDLREALSLAQRIVSQNTADGIFLTGSTYLVGEAMSINTVESLKCKA
ncbi:MAG: bifunctional folylpolyglutamate synthase/dihydrofolate synthase [Candidatus Aureabacteria bacterium]|nr:bifunctional folylpolyglutamate synthase/dihydrofolate synthase [Candidatus Auribacterota bacterium]